LDIHPEPSSKLTAVFGAQRTVANAGDNGCGRTQSGDTALRSVEIMRSELRPNDKLKERDAGVEQGTHGGIGAVLTNVAGVHAFWVHGDERLCKKLVVEREGFECGVLARLVTVEGEDDARAACTHLQLSRAGVAHEAADDLHVFLA